MCGILLSLKFSTNVTENEENCDIEQVANNVSKRGPDYHSSVELEIPASGSGYCSKISLKISSWVLHLRGKALQKQPVCSTAGNVLAFNGEIYEFGDGSESCGFDSGNDTDILSKLLSHASPSEPAILNVIGKLKGEWALAYYVASTGILYFGRDFLGRRALLYRRSTEDGSLLISSVSNGPERTAPNTDAPSSADNVTEGDISSRERKVDWIELGCGGLFKLELRDAAAARDENLNLVDKMVELPWGGEFLSFPANTQMNMHSVDPERDLTNLDKINLSELPSVLTNEQENAKDRLLEVLSASVLCRTRSIPTYNYKSEMDTSRNPPSKLAILFSGGLDCMVLAALASIHLDELEPIDLLNVSFENPRSLKARRAKGGDSPALPFVDPYSTPDRKTGMDGYGELCKLFPSRKWRFVNVNVEYEEAMSWKSYIMELMYPLTTVIDLSIAMAFWFASRGIGYLRPLEGAKDGAGQEEAYTSSARVLLSGLGADEQLGGYSRHRKAFDRDGWSELAKEIAVDVGRIAIRNMGRDDRIISSHGKEVRFPFLDENVFGYLSSLPVHIKTDPRFDRAVGDKILLRLVAKELGLDRAAVEAKRAVQFGARTAKMDLTEGSKQKGHHQIRLPK